MLSTSPLRLSWTVMVATATLISYLHPDQLGVAAHSWLDCIDHSVDVVYTQSDKWVLTGAAGDGVCEGYPYNFPGRGVDAIGAKYTHKLLPEDIANDNVPVCQYRAQDANYTGWRKAIEAKAGDKLYFAYFSNGHVVKDKAGLGTTHGVYWDGRPGVELEKPSQLTKKHLVDGQLHDFDDDNCGQSFVDGDFVGGTIPSGRAGDFKPCVGSFTIPKDTKAGTYPMVWWWTFFKVDDFGNGFRNFEGTDGATYSSCFNVIVKETSGAINEEAAVQGETDTAAIEKKAMAAYLTPVKADEAKSPSHDPAKCGVVSDGGKPKKDSVAVKASDTKMASSDQQNSGASEQNLTPTPTPSSSVPSPTTATPSSPAPSTPAPTPSPSTTPAPTPTSTTSAPTVMPTPAPTLPPTTVAPTLFVASNIFAAPLSAITISGVGGKGSYGKVTNMACPGTPNTCEQSATDVSGPLAPFDEDLTLALRGPLEVDDIVVFTKSDASQWSKVSSYSKANSEATQNMVFLNNKGDPEKSGEFSMCHGNSQSFATSNGSTAASSSTAFDGVLGDGVEVNVMSETTCAASGTCGFARGVAHEGWRGEHKIFMVKAQMPHATQEAAKDLPAIWLLNGQVVRTAEYGCNCRGVGDQGSWKGGCGELDVAEVIPENKEMLTSTIYSFKGSRGISPVVARPTDGRVVFVVIFSTDASGAGTVQILMMRPDNVDIANAPSAQRVDEWLAYRNGQQVNFNI